MEYINILVTEPQKVPYIIRIKNELEPIQQIIGSQALNFLEYNNQIIITALREQQRTPNIKIDNNVIYGTFVICSADKDGDFVSVTKKNQKKLCKIIIAKQQNLKEAISLME
ncbi:MAG: DUF3846 domain-containing protein [Oscillospiraceae bacterium]